MGGGFRTMANIKKESLEKPKKENLVLLIARVKLKYQLNTGNKVFQELNISNVSIFLIDCQSYTFLLKNIIISDIFI